MDRSHLVQKIQERKKQLRTKYINQRKHLSSLQWQKKSENICHHLAKCYIFGKKKGIFRY